MLPRRQGLEACCEDPSDEVIPIAGDARSASEAARNRRFPRPGEFALLAFFQTVCALCAVYMLYPAVGSAQEAASVSGLGQGERDTMRVESRMKGREEQVIDSRVSDQKIGAEERHIRLERRAEELLREEEGARQRQERYVKDREEAGARARRREEEDIQRKKRAVDISPDL